MSIAALSGDNIYSPIDAYSFITGDNGTRSKYIASSPLTTFQPNDLIAWDCEGIREQYLRGRSGIHIAGSVDRKRTSAPRPRRLLALAATIPALRFQQRLLADCHSGNRAQTH